MEVFEGYYEYLQDSNDSTDFNMTGGPVGSSVKMLSTDLLSLDRSADLFIWARALLCIGKFVRHERFFKSKVGKSLHGCMNLKKKQQKKKQEVFECRTCRENTVVSASITISLLEFKSS